MATKIYIDGSGSSSHCGGKFAAVFVEENCGIEEITSVQYRESETKLTCNEAEYHALILALEEMLHGEEIEIFSDSQLVVNQMKREKPWKVNFEHLKILNSFANDIIDNFNLNVKLTWVSRDQNLAGLYLEGKLKVPEDKVLNSW